MDHLCCVLFCLLHKNAKGQLCLILRAFALMMMRKQGAEDTCVNFSPKPLCEANTSVTCKLSKVAGQRVGIPGGIRGDSRMRNIGACHSELEEEIKSKKLVKFLKCTKKRECTVPQHMVGIVNMDEEDADATFATLTSNVTLCKTPTVPVSSNNEDETRQESSVNQTLDDEEEVDDSAVCGVLNEIGLSTHANTFKDNKMSTVDDLKSLSATDMREMGTKAVGDHDRLVNWIAAEKLKVAKEKAKKKQEDLKQLRENMKRVWEEVVVKDH